ncbi:GNAT family N-acetyltransferase [Planctomycetes bacterium K23_9]|uniref:Putative N-acetyltransferase YjcF n=1 Tax=Stieleria marina TaxID=1930275 RepID=A0A517P338_9BACT|nr:putative N-acetyltransferase YjcF [Planctomycetes bacterium K23_9]
MQFIEMTWRSKYYNAEIQLRDELLRRPLGLTFTAPQLAAESEELRWGVIDKEELIAVVLGKPISQTAIKLRQMAVAAEHQRRGVGRFLLENVERDLVGKGFQRIELNARDVAQGFYDSLGYVTEGERFVEVGIPHFRMVKSLRG